MRNMFNLKKERFSVIVKTTWTITKLIFSMWLPTKEYHLVDPIYSQFMLSSHSHLDLSSRLYMLGSLISNIHQLWWCGSTMICIGLNQSYKILYIINIQPWHLAFRRLLNNPYVNEVNLTGQNLPLNFCYPLEILTQFQKDLDLSLLKIWRL